MSNFTQKRLAQTLVLIASLISLSGCSKKESPTGNVTTVKSAGVPTAIQVNPGAIPPVNAQTRPDLFPDKDKPGVNDGR